MTSFSTRARVRLLSNGVVQRNWQNYDPAAASFYPFDVSEMAATLTGSMDPIEVTLPAARDVLITVESAIAAAWTAEVYLDRNGVQDLVFVGEVLGGACDESTFVVEIGSSLASVGKQVPPRLYSEALIGEPPKL